MQTGNNSVLNWKFLPISFLVVASFGRSGQAFYLWDAPMPRIFAIQTLLRMSNQDQDRDLFQNISTSQATRVEDLSTTHSGPPKLADAPFQPSGMNSNDQSPSESLARSQTPSPFKKYHHLTVCMVPPESSVLVWETITKCRTELKDPGLYRWPPHANLLYPFIDLQSVQQSVTQMPITNDEFSVSPFNIHPSIIHGLLEACRQVDPFHVKLQQFGTFGSKKRGVLWLYPESFYGNETDSSAISPLMRLQSLLVQSFPQCNDQNMKSSNSFNPHMTVSHFINHEEALAAQKRVEQCWPADRMIFPVRHIYLLQRTGDAGQFLRVADIPLGSQHADKTVIHTTPLPFLHMPSTEVDWVYEERMKLKQRRNGQWRSRSRNKGDSRTSNFPAAEQDPLTV
jgi:2'-5' RNA ligase